MKRSKWLSGECYAFTEALAGLTGWDKAALVTGILKNEQGDVLASALIHGVLVHPDGGYVDALGRVTAENLCERYCVDAVEFSPTSISSLRGVGGYNGQEVRQAKIAIYSYAKTQDPFFSKLNMKSLPISRTSR